MADSSSLLNNPLLATTGLPDYAAIRPEHIVPAVKHIVEEATQKLAAIEQKLTPTWEGSLGALEKLDPPFEYGWKPVGHLFGVLNSDDLRAAYETVLPEVVQFGLRASQSEPIYRTLKQLRDSDEWSRLSEARQRIVTDRIKGAELSGITLTGVERERFNAIVQETIATFDGILESCTRCHQSLFAGYYRLRRRGRLAEYSAESGGEIVECGSSTR